MTWSIRHVNTMIQLANSMSLPLQNARFSSALSLFLLRKSIFYSNATPNSQCGQCTQEKQLCNPIRLSKQCWNQKTLTGLFHALSYTTKCLLFLSLLTFFRRFSPQKKRLITSQKPTVTEMKWNKNDQMYNDEDRKHETGILEGRASLYYKSKLSKCFQHQNGLAAWGDRCFGRDKTDNVKWNMCRLLKKVSFAGSWSLLKF